MLSPRSGAALPLRNLLTRKFRPLGDDESGHPLSRDGRFAASGQEDATIYLWDLDLE
jgi:hypothetical protein